MSDKHQYQTEVLMSRLNQLNNMQAAIMGSIGAIGIGVLAAATGLDSNSFMNQESIKNVILLLSFVVLGSCHLFSMYQMAAIFKCGLVMKELEESKKKLDPDNKSDYFSGGNMTLRNLLHFVSHSMPSFILGLFPICLGMLGLLETSDVLWGLLLILLLSLLFWSLLVRAMGLPKLLKFI